MCTSQFSPHPHEPTEKLGLSTTIQGLNCGNKVYNITLQACTNLLEEYPDPLEMIFVGI